MVLPPTCFQHRIYTEMFDIGIGARALSYAEEFNPPWKNHGAENWRQWCAAERATDLLLLHASVSALSYSAYTIARSFT